MVDGALRVASVVLGGVIGIAAGATAGIVLIVAAYWFFTRQPSAESEVRKLFDQQSLSDVVTVGDCRYSEADSVYDMYACELVATRHVKHEEETFRAGSSTYCFSVPRAEKTGLGGTDEDPTPLWPPGEDGRC